MPSILYLENGRSSDQTALLFGDLFERVDVCSFNHANLLVYDILIVPSYSNEDILKKNQERLNRFLRYGGLLIALGALQNKRKWFGHCSYHRPFLREVRFRNTDSQEAKTILQGLSLSEDSVRYHDTFVSHGTFTAHAKDCLPLITGEDPKDLVLAIIRPPGLKGKALITTLDPDYHASMGQTREGVEWAQEAQKLYRGIVDWAIQEAETLDPISMAVRKVIGMSQRALTLAVLTAAIAICAGSILGFLLGRISMEMFGVIASVSSILSLGFSLVLRRHG